MFIRTPISVKLFLWNCKQKIYYDVEKRRGPPVMNGRPSFVLCLLLGCYESIL
nr:MAG TPA: hypothetical protein [Caudoviricetes sp.]